MKLEKKSKYTFEVNAIWLPLVIFACVLNMTFAFIPLLGMLLAIVSWVITGIFAHDKLIWKRVKIIAGLIILEYIGIVTLSFSGGAVAVGVSTVGHSVFGIALIVYAVRIREEVAEKINNARGNRKSVTNSRSRVGETVELPQELEKRKEEKDYLVETEKEEIKPTDSAKRARTLDL